MIRLLAGTLVSMPISGARTSVTVVGHVDRGGAPRAGAGLVPERGPAASALKIAPPPPIEDR
jgi:hypothetical protein